MPPGRSSAGMPAASVITTTARTLSLMRAAMPPISGAKPGSTNSTLSPA